MNYFTERHGMRKPVEQTYDIDPSKYYVLLRCCEKYYDNIAWLYPEECEDGFGCCGLDKYRLAAEMKYEIPDLYFNEYSLIDAPRVVNNMYNVEQHIDKYNQYAVIVMDSDKRKATDTINHTKQRVQEEFEKHGFMCWITAGKEIENYLTAKSVNSAYENKTTKLEKDIGKYKLFPNYVKDFEKNFTNVKVSFAKKVSPHITENDFRFDLREQIAKLANNIETWNMVER